MVTDARHRVSSRLAAGLLLTSFLASLTAAQTWAACGKSGNYAANSIYQANLDQLSATLPTNASGALFATATVGAAPDVVYALALCRGDSSASTCDSCVASAFQEAMQQCPYIRDVAVLLDECNLRFSDTNFLATIDNTPILIVNDSQRVILSVDKFDDGVGRLLNAITDYAVANSSRKFATGEEATRSSDFTIYGLAHCTPDLSPADCRNCLQQVLAERPQYLSGRQGGRICGVRCNFRYELNNKFFTGGTTMRLQTQLWPPPAPAPPNKNATQTPTLGGNN